MTEEQNVQGEQTEGTSGEVTLQVLQPRAAYEEWKKRIYPKGLLPNADGELYGAFLCGMLAGASNTQLAVNGGCQAIKLMLARHAKNFAQQREERKKSAANN